MNEAVARCARAMARDGDVFLPDQFSNPANPDVHRRTHRPGAVGGAGRQGRLPRRGRRHRRDDHRRRLVPEGAQQGRPGDRRRAGDLARALRRAPGPHKIQGIGAGFVPPVLQRDLLDEIIAVEDEDAIETARLSARREGVLCGISCGAAL